MGPFWVRPQGPRSTIASAMSSIHRTSRTPGTPMTPSGFDGKDGVDGSSPSEGFKKPAGNNGRRCATLAERLGSDSNAEPPALPLAALLEPPPPPRRTAPSPARRFQRRRCEGPVIELHEGRLLHEVGGAPAGSAGASSRAPP